MSPKSKNGANSVDFLPDGNYVMIRVRISMKMHFFIFPRQKMLIEFVNESRKNAVVKTVFILHIGTEFLKSSFFTNF